MIKKCKLCSKEFIKKSNESNKYWVSKKYCSSKCSLIITSINLEKGRIKGKKLSKSTKIKIRIANKGSKNYFWKGGKSNLKRQIINLFEYRQWRSDVYHRDDFTCQECGIRGGKLECHHIKALSVILNSNNIKSIKEAIDCNELWDINNGQTLCKNCHTLTDNYGFKANPEWGI